MNSNEQNRIEYLNSVIDQLQTDKYRLEKDIQHAEKDRKQIEADLAAEQHKNYRLRTDMDCLVKETKHYVSDVEKSALSVANKCTEQAELIGTLKDALTTANKKRKEAWDKNQSLLHEIEKLKCAYRNSQHEFIRKDVEKDKIAQTLVNMDEVLVEKMKVIEMLTMDRRELIGDNRELKEELEEKMGTIKKLKSRNFDLNRETSNQAHLIKKLQRTPEVATAAETPEARDLRLAVMAFASSEMKKKMVSF